MRFHFVLMIVGGLFILSCCSSGAPDTTIDQDTTTDTNINCEVALPCSGDYVIESAGELADVAQCKSITGRLEVDGQDWLTDLNLPCLESVSDDLVIWNNFSLASISIPNVVSVGDELYIGWTKPKQRLEDDALTDIEMPSLTSVGSFGLGTNDSLTSLTGLSNLSTVSRDMYIGRNYSLTTLDGLAKLKSVGGDLRIKENACLRQAEIEVFAASVKVAGITEVEENGFDCPAN